jgi:aminopeptidase N
VFDNISEKPVLSLNRSFSAPINLDFEQSEADLLSLLSSDDDPFNRWEAGQKLAMQMILNNRLPDAAVMNAYRNLLLDPELDPAFKELALTLPAESYLYEQCSSVDPQQIFTARRAFRKEIAKQLQLEWAALYQQNQTPGPFKSDAKDSGKRALKNLALSMLLEADPKIWAPMAVNQYQIADNMTDRYAALAALVMHGAKGANDCLNDFFSRFANDALVIDKWFALQSSRPPVDGLESTLADVKRLRDHPAFKLNNPNRARSVIHAFCANNPASFHQADGSGYAFWAESVLALDPINPQVAARLARALDRWRLFAQPYQSHMKAALEQVAACPTLSPDVREVVSKALGN